MFDSMEDSANLALARAREEGQKQAAAILAERELIGPGEVAALTGLHRKTVRRLTLSGIIPFAYELDSGQFRYNREAVKRWFEATRFIAEHS